MEFTTTPNFKSRKPADLLVIPYWKSNEHVQAAFDIDSLKKILSEPLSTHDFHGKEGEIMFLYVSGQPEKRLALIGLGVQTDITVEKLRRAYANITRVCHKNKLKEINICLPKCTSMAQSDVVTGISEGLLLPNYIFTALRKHTIKDDQPVLLEKATIIEGSRSDLALAKRSSVICESVNFVRDLVNGNADDVTPQHLSAVARGLEKTSKNVKTTVFDKKRIEKEKMGLLLAVNRGSNLDPAFIIIEYKGNPKSTDRTVIVGKGITYDTGGLLIKPRGSMETMKEDMAGAAAALGIIHAAAALELKINVTSVIPTTENSIGSKSYKPGDVYTSYTGKTIEISDTDAEGRLVLADALAYAVKNLKPTRMIDMATLTGAIMVALGEEASGLMSNNDVLADLLARAGSGTGERVWRMPLYEEFKEQLKSDVADMKNTGGRLGGAITAAMFLQEFVGKTPWAHLDIAGTAFHATSKRYNPKHATGVGVRLILSFLESI
ncbi:MAG TPA: leucyl aminopeptidase [Parachlamydiaceae bacterium]|nr:leucyl aminopeptidase [Parachlamydiaceae bacterium]